MSAHTRKHFSGAFKAKVALEAIRAVKTVDEIAQEYGVHPTQVGQWKKELPEQAADLFDAKRGPKPADPSASPERLYPEIERLKMELDWLKKSLGYACSHTDRLGKTEQILEQELSEIDRRIDHLAEAIAATGVSQTIYGKLRGEEHLKQVVQNKLLALTEIAEARSLDPARLVEDLSARINDLRGLLTRQGSEARSILKTALNGSLIFQPVEIGGKSGYRFQGTGSYGRLLAYAQASNDGGGGHLIQPSLIPLLRFEIQGVALVA